MVIDAYEFTSTSDTATFTVAAIVLPKTSDSRHRFTVNIPCYNPHKSVYQVWEHFCSCSVLSFLDGD